MVQFASSRHRYTMPSRLPRSVARTRSLSAVPPEGEGAVGADVADCVTVAALEPKEGLMDVRITDRNGPYLGTQSRNLRAHRDNRDFAPGWGDSPRTKPVRAVGDGTSG